MVIRAAAHAYNIGIVSTRPADEMWAGRRGRETMEGPMGRGGRLWSLCAALLAALALAPVCRAQLVPARTYYGKDRPIPMTVTIPSGMEGEAEIHLLPPGPTGSAAAAEAAQPAPVAPGLVNLATLFPDLWITTQPRVLYAQLVVGGEKVGPAVVLQPMLTPAYAATVDSGGNPRFPNEMTRQKVYSGIRAYTDKHVVLETNHGEIELAMRPDAAPNTVWNFLQLVEGGFYTDVVFHRVVAADARGDAFVIQTGDPTGTGTGGPGYHIDLEPSTLPHGFGVASMARTSDPNTGGSQIFICLSRAGTAMLDGKYTSFAQAVRGGEVIHAIASVKVQAGDRPLEPAPRILSARVIDAPPRGEGPAPLPEPGTGPIAR